jgi:chitodextrinase
MLPGGRVKKIIAAAATVVALTGCATSALAAPAGRTPVVYAGGSPWANPARKPHSLFLGADFSVTHMSWSRWSGTGAFGHGHLVACAGAAGPCVKFRAGVTLSTVKTHHSTKYFASMKLTGAHHKTQRLKMRDGLWVLVTSGYGS